MDAAMKSWMGKNIDDVVREWGAPTSTASNRSGGVTYIWIKIRSTEYGIRQCSQSFTTDRAGTIEHYSYSNCPPIVKNF